jgi:DNA-binding MarR family transcriptional regulator
MLIEPATLTGMLQHLESAGWIRRDVDERNRRLQRVWLTTQARTALPEISQAQEWHRKRALARLSSEQLAALEETVIRIEENLTGSLDE